VRHAFKDLQHGGNPGLTQLAVGANRVAEEQVARARRQDRWREPMEIPVDGRELRVLEIMTVGIQQGRLRQIASITDQDVVHPFIGLVAVARLRQVRPGRA
jgi:hypothetical protein